MRQDNLVRLLREMAEIVDRPNGLGGGAILRAAAQEIEDLRRHLTQRLAPPEPIAT